MKNTITLNGHTFTVHRSKYVNMDILHRYSGRTLDDCYARPSYSKQYIYKMWEEWAHLNDVEYFGVSGYNGFQFTLQGLVHQNNHTYILHITKSGNKAYIVE